VECKPTQTILIAGYYGYGNAGDEATLSAMLADLHGRGEDLEYIVVSGNPPETAAWIKQLAVEGATSGCDASVYCPKDPVTRSQKAIFLIRTFYLPSSPIIESTSAFSTIPL
jgi:hypothetical protein